jgi:hypothetical protein
MTDADDSFVGGLSIPQCSDDALLLLQDARKDGFDFITTNLPHSSSMSRRDVTLIESKWWSTSIVGMVTTPSSPFYYSDDDDDDDDDEDMDKHEEEDDDEQIPKWNFGQDIISALSNPHKSPTATKHLEYMLEWTAHMNIPAAILPPIPPRTRTKSKPDEQYLQYGRFLATQVLKSSANNVQLWVRVNFDRESVERFMTIHRMCDGASNLGCILVFQSTTPTVIIQKGSNDADGDNADGNADQKEDTTNTMSMAEAMSLMHQLVGCNLRAVTFHTDTFLANKRGFPTLSKAMQILFVELCKRLGRTCRVLVEGMPQSMHEPSSQSSSASEGGGKVMGHSGLLLYLQYLRHLRSKDEVKRLIDTEEAKMETGYLDHLQSALHPLGDNLEFATYEVVSRTSEGGKRVSD